METIAQALALEKEFGQKESELLEVQATTIGATVEVTAVEAEIVAATRELNDIGRRSVDIERKLDECRKLKADLEKELDHAENCAIDDSLIMEADSGWAPVAWAVALSVVLVVPDIIAVLA
ncbi:hypothetical protein HK104_010917 [Borealophlyctis nickersoniae]|nr:hypothetical protein HK104_010917 [Borealophlyctis nickersoniae]